MRSTSKSSPRLWRTLAEQELASIQKTRADALQAQAVEEVKPEAAPPAPPPVVLPPTKPDPLADVIGKVAQSAEPTSESWKPNPGRQTEFIESSAYEVLFGGSAGGGKTTGLLYGGLRHVAETAFSAIYFRRVFPELAKSVIPTSARVFPKLGARYNENKHSWTFPSGATYTFSHLQYEDDVEAHLSAEYQYLAFDELTTFTERQYTRILGRGRSSSGIPVRVRASTNPGGEGADWVQRRWAPWLGVPPGDPEWKGPKAQPGEVLWYVNEESGERYVSDAEAQEMLARWLAASEKERVYMPLPLTRTFIPARVEDNPMLVKNDPAYVQRLMGLDPVRRAQLLHGDWNVRPAAGKYFNRSWFKFVDAPPAQVQLRVRHWDLAGTEPESGSDPDWTVGCKLSIDDAGHLCIEDAHRGQWSEFETERQLLATAELDGKATHISLPQDPGQAGKFQASYLVGKLNGYTVRAERETGDKVTRAGPISSQCAAGNVSIVRGPWNEAFLRVLERFPAGKKDDVDALSGAHRYLTSRKPSKPLGRIDLSAGVRQNPWDFTGG